ncbi:MAG: carboxypeptidase-like regulatory domain-containing protein, partial [Tannerella sp.]|nr:carboxypeptidase-like regulatory domain-containing protein [Tannerella sp.]
MKTFLVCLCLLTASAVTLSAQTLRGTVLDAGTGEPVAFANVYLEGTTFGTATNPEGEFSISVKNRINTRLIVSYTGYETVVISNPFETMPEIIYLTEMENKLSEVVVTGKSAFTERQKRNAFCEQFLGSSVAGSLCRILNEDAIRLVYDPETRRLHGYADVPVEIENRRLGYRIQWDLVEFTLYLKSPKSLDSKNVDSVYIFGFPFFEDVKKYVIQYETRRRKIYDISQRRFFKLLADGTLAQSDFRLFDEVKAAGGVQPLPVDSMFTLINTPSDTAVAAFAMNPEKRDSTGSIGVFVANVVEVPAGAKRYIERSSLFMGSEVRDTHFYSRTLSKLSFTVDTFRVDRYGNTDLNDIRGLRVGGVMGDQRVGDMLPLDYLPVY